MSSSSILSAALAYANAGYAVLPIGRNKHPVTENGTRDATTDRVRICTFWEIFSTANVAIAAGPISSIFVLDVDGEAGRHMLRNLVDRHGQLPHAPANLTARGCHLVFAMPADGREPRSRCGGVRLGLGDGLDIRADGCCFTVPSSRHESGHVYRWARGRSILELAPPQAPDWLVEAACRTPERKQPVAPAQPPVDGGWGPTPAYARAALDRAARTVAGALPGVQEATLNAEAYSIGQLVAGGAMPAKFARDVLIWAGVKMTNGNARRPWLQHEIETKVDRAFADAVASPRTAPERNRQ